MKTDMTRRNLDDFFIQIRPEIKKGTWTGQIAINIIFSDQNSLNEKDKMEIWHLCRMMTSVIPMMELDKDLMEDIDDFARNYMEDYDKEKKLKKGLTVVGKDGNVIKLGLLTKTKGNA